jgi:hypothetical protein
MTALIQRDRIDGSKPDTPEGVNTANFLLGTGNAWDCLQTLGIGVSSVAAGTATLTQANAGLVLADASAGNVVITMPAVSAAVGAVFQFKRVDSTANTVTINRVGGDTIDGATSAILVGQYDFWEIRSDGVSAWRGLGALASAITAVGQCRLILSAGSLKLSAMDGNRLTVNGRNCTIPDAGVTLAATGLTATTRYYIYAVAAAGVVTSLEASTTGHSIDTTALNKGVEIKTGDSTRTLVGMAYVKTAATFADTPAQRFVLSWFNRKSITGSAPFTSNVAGSSTTYAELSSSFRLEFLNWSGDIVDLRFSGPIFGNAAGSYVQSTFGIDSTTAAEDAFSQLALLGANQGTSQTLQFGKTGLSEGYHYATVLCNNAGAGNAYTAQGGGPGGRCVISAIYQG